MPRIVGMIIFLGLLSMASSSIAGARISEQVEEILENRLKAIGPSSKVVCRGEWVCQSAVLLRFYELRSFRPVWSDDGGPLPRAESLLRRIEAAPREGLRPEDYHLAQMKFLLAETHQEQTRKILRPEELADLDLLLTDSFLTYAFHLLSGRINSETIRAKWHIQGRKEDIVAILQEVLDSQQIEKTLPSLLPSNPGYSRLRETLQKYRTIAQKGGWPKIAANGPKMRLGLRDKRVESLRLRLRSSEGMPLWPSGDVDFFDAVLDQAVRRFQQRHGLETDGVVGPATLTALNIPVEKRIRQIEANMERWRWFPRNLGDQYILVNIANFELQVIEIERPILAMKVVVGKHYQRTPVFNADMTYLVFGPYWNVPPRIAREEMLPAIRKDPEYLAKNHLRVLQGWGPGMKEIDPQAIDWANLTPDSFPFHIRQDPGPTNALGRVKFMFPNKFNVYLHDTPARELFRRIDRGFSHGCIRVENPFELAEYVLKDDPRWTRERILAAMEESKDRKVRLAKPVPVYVLYQTAWVEEDGSVHFRKDIYGQDEILENALAEKIPTA